jgi:hypothetical protein
MTWTRIPDDWSDRIDDLELSHDAELFHIRALVLCNKAGNDGHLKERNLRKLAAVFDNAPALIAELIEKLGWIDNGDGTYSIPWEEQEEAEVVARRAEQNRERNRRYRAKKLDMQEDDLNDASPNASRKSKRSDKGSSTRDASDDAEGDATPFRPVPSRPYKGKGTGTDIASPNGRSVAGAPPPSVGAQQKVVEKSAPKDPRLEGIEDLLGPLHR